MDFEEFLTARLAAGLWSYLFSCFFFLKYSKEIPL
jgi:hypothetical protein